IFMHSNIFFMDPDKISKQADKERKKKKSPPEKTAKKQVKIRRKNPDGFYVYLKIYPGSFLKFAYLSGALIGVGMIWYWGIKQNSILEPDSINWVLYTGLGLI